MSVANRSILPPLTPQQRMERVLANIKTMGSVRKNSAFGPTFATDTQGATRDPFSTGRAWDNLFRVNPRLKMAIETVLDATFMVTGTVKANDSNDYTRYPEYRERDKILIDLAVRQLAALGNRYEGFADIQRSLVKQAIITGYCIGLKQWAPRNGVWWLTDVIPYSPWYFSPWEDAYGNLTAIYHYLDGQYYQPEAFVYAPWNSHTRNWLGVSEIEALEQEVLQLNAAIKLRETSFHRGAMTPHVLYYDAEQPADVTTPVMQLVADLESNSVLNLPMFKSDAGGGVEQTYRAFEFVPMPDRSSNPLLDQLSQEIDRLEKSISRTIGLPDQLGSTTTIMGSWAQSRTQRDMFTMKPERLALWSAHQTTTQILYDVFFYNYPTWVCDSNYLLPFYGHDLINDESLDLEAKRHALLVEKGIEEKDEARQAMGMGKLDTAGTAETVQE